MTTTLITTMPSRDLPCRKESLWTVCPAPLQMAVPVQAHPEWIRKSNRMNGKKRPDWYPKSWSCKIHWMTYRSESTASRRRISNWSRRIRSWASTLRTWCRPVQYSSQPSSIPKRSECRMGPLQGYSASLRPQFVFIYIAVCVKAPIYVTYIFIHSLHRWRTLNVH